MRPGAPGTALRLPLRYFVLAAQETIAPCCFPVIRPALFHPFDSVVTAETNAPWLAAEAYAAAI